VALLEIREVSRSFGEFKALDRVSLDVNAGEFFTLLGPSGCGKTTLLRQIAGFERLDSGDILLDGKSLNGVAPEERPVHTVFQSYALFPHMTVAENIAFPLRMARVAPEEIKRRVAETLERVHLPDFGNRAPHELSGGQKQRVAIGRALVNRPRLLLLDEPLAALDLKLRERMQIELINLQKEVGITFVYVTHDQGEALALSHRIAVMNHGRIEQVDEPDKLYSAPVNRFVADFIGQCNLLEATVGAKLDAGWVELLLFDGTRVPTLAAPETVAASTPGRKGVLALRPEKVRIASSLAPDTHEVHLKGTVHDLLYTGDVTVYIVELPSGLRIESLLANSAAGRTRFFEVGDQVELAWANDAGLFLLD
jgi:spermidine/putrescine transport system ATP-binding protein